MLKSNLLVREGDGSNLLYNLLGLLKIYLFEELDFFFEHSLDIANLNRSSAIWIKFIKDEFNVVVWELERRCRVIDFFEVLL